MQWVKTPEVAFQQAWDPNYSYSRTRDVPSPNPSAFTVARFAKCLAATQPSVIAHSSDVLY